MPEPMLERSSTRTLFLWIRDTRPRELFSGDLSCSPDGFAKRLLAVRTGG